LLLLALLQYAYYQLNELYVLRDEVQIGSLLLGLVVLGSVMGFFSSYRSVRKYLGMSLDELY
jgi:cell division transport system permease protein